MGMTFELGIGRGVRFLLRGVVGGIVFVFVGLFFLNLGNRGFLRSAPNRGYWVEVDHSSSWKVVASAQASYESPPQASVPGSRRIFIEEHSMGRMHNLAASWRTTSWSLVWIIDDRGLDVDLPPNSDAMKEMDAAIDAHVREVLIPNRTPQAGWEAIPIGEVRHDLGYWSIWQNRFVAGVFVVQMAITCACAILAAVLLPIPKRVRETAAS